MKYKLLALFLGFIATSLAADYQPCTSFEEGRFSYTRLSLEEQKEVEHLRNLFNFETITNTSTPELFEDFAGEKILEIETQERILAKIGVSYGDVFPLGEHFLKLNGQYAGIIDIDFLGDQEFETQMGICDEDLSNRVPLSIYTYNFDETEVAQFSKNLLAKHGRPESGAVLRLDYASYLAPEKLAPALQLFVERVIKPHIGHTFPVRADPEEFLQLSPSPLSALYFSTIQSSQIKVAELARFEEFSKKEMLLTEGAPLDHAPTVYFYDCL